MWDRGLKPLKTGVWIANRETGEYSHLAVRAGHLQICCRLECTYEPVRLANEVIHIENADGVPIGIILLRYGGLQEPGDDLHSGSDGVLRQILTPRHFARSPQLGAYMRQAANSFRL